MPTTFDDSLLKWSDIQADFVGGTLLIGNGASCAVWADFSYNSLYDLATTPGCVNHPISDKAQTLFDELDTKNFEEVLLLLQRTKQTCTTLGQGETWLRPAISKTLDDNYKNIKQALVEAVHSIHIPWARIPANNLEAMGREYLKYDSVFSTNYDLLLYWSIMKCNPSHEEARDFFWGQPFDVARAESQSLGDETKLYYLHGGLHLYRSENGSTQKRTAGQNQNLLDLFGEPFNSAEPLFISEATTEQKLAAIRRSDYLLFAHSHLVRNTNNLTIFGSSLGNNDRHIAEAICASGPNRNRKVAIGLRSGGTPEAIIRQKLDYDGKLKPRLRTDPVFFDRSTHPLGSPALSVAP